MFVSTFIPDLNPANAILYSNRAFTYLKMRNYELALSDARAAVTRDPEWMKVCACVRACVHACVRACMRACVCD